MVLIRSRTSELELSRLWDKLELGDYTIKTNSSDKAQKACKTFSKQAWLQ